MEFRVNANVEVKYPVRLSVGRSISFDSTLLQDRLLQCQEEELLTDSVIVFHGERFSCHSYYLASFSPFLRTKFSTSSTEVVFTELEASVSDANLFFQLFQYFYGHPLQLTVQNVDRVLSLCSSLQLELLSQSIHEKMKTGLDLSKPFQLQLDSNEIVTRMSSNFQRDIVLIYLDEEVVISSICLICCSKIFKDQFCSNFADHSLRKFSYHDEFIGVTGDEFQSFFDSFTGKAIILNSDNVVSFHQLAVYFQVEELKKECIGFLTGVTDDSELIQVLSIAVERHVFNFLLDISEILKS
ncbi:hypothetical protein GEMRC1_005089 [Eukaryota sp. GEM-RC1]